MSIAPDTVPASAPLVTREVIVSDPPRVNRPRAAAVIIASTTLAMHFRRIARQTGIAALERSLVATQPAFEKKAIGAKAA